MISKDKQGESGYFDLNGFHVFPIRGGGVGEIGPTGLREGGWGAQHIRDEGAILGGIPLWLPLRSSRGVDYSKTRSFKRG